MNTARLEQGHRCFAFFYSRFIAPAAERQWGDARRRVMSGLHGKVLEIGAGSGTSFSYYPRDLDVIATEPDPHMLKRARARPFGEASFDDAVCCWVLCTVDDPAKTLAEARRVLKPDGTFSFMDHVRNDRSAFWSSAQNVIAPVWRPMGAGCRLTQRTEPMIEAAGFRFEWIERVQGWIQPVIYGVARPQ